MPRAIYAPATFIRCDDGVLTLTVPKSEEKKPKQIKVKATKKLEGK